MTPEAFRTELEAYGIYLTDTQMRQFEDYYRLLAEWNEKINLTAITEKKEVYLKHFFDSLTVAFMGSFDLAASLCDVGSGAGFPSLPLKIAFPELKVTIVDSLNKRISFLKTVAETLELKNVTLYHDRAESFGQNTAFRETFDLVTARAVARLNVLAELCLPLVKPEGFFLAMKAVKSEDELEEAGTAIAKLGGQLKEEKAFSLPEAQGERHILVIRKQKNTPKKYPRRPGLPNKQPIK